MSNTEWLAANPGKTIVELLEWRATQPAALAAPGHGEVDHEGYVHYVIHYGE